MALRARPQHMCKFADVQDTAHIDVAGALKPNIDNLSIEELTQDVISFAKRETLLDDSSFFDVR